MQQKDCIARAGTLFQAVATLCTHHLGLSKCLHLGFQTLKQHDLVHGSKVSVLFAGATELNISADDGIEYSDSNASERLSGEWSWLSAA